MLLLQQVLLFQQPKLCPFCVFMSLGLVGTLIELPRPTLAGQATLKMAAGLIALGIVERYCFPWKQTLLPNESFVGTNVGQKLRNWKPSMGKLVALSKPDCPICVELQTDCQRESAPILHIEPCSTNPKVPCYGSSLQVRVVPTLLLLNSQGQVLEQTTGYNKDIKSLKDKALRANAQGITNESK
jgi:hypothetical protein